MKDIITTNIKYVFIQILLYIIVYFILITILSLYEKIKKYDIIENYNGIYTAIIIEPRKHKALHHVLKNFTSMLDNKWNFIIFHGKRNHDFVTKIVDALNNKNKIKMINLNVDNLSLHDYNALLYDKTFYENIPTEIFLIFQTDTLICELFKNNINDFLEYDYVGAPWIDGKIGNGGLSLRKKSKMLEIIDKCGDRKYNDHTKLHLHNEDAFFSLSCNDKVNLKIPSFDDAKKFSIETVYNNESFGIHKCWKYNNEQQIKNINNFCPGLNKLIKLNK